MNRTGIRFEREGIHFLIHYIMYSKFYKFVGIHIQLKLM